MFHPCVEWIWRIGCGRRIRFAFEERNQISCGCRHLITCRRRTSTGFWRNLTSTGGREGSRNVVEVYSTREPMLVTRRGKAIAYVAPAGKPEKFIGSLKGIIKIFGDIESPVVPP